MSIIVLTLGLPGLARAQHGEYLLGPGDLIRVNVSEHPELGNDVRVSQSGNITFPYIGEQQVGGLSPQTLEELLARRLGDGGFIKNPQVAVLIVEYQSQRVAVIGQVNKPGQYSVLTARCVVNLLAEAGGTINERAADQATLMRRDGSIAYIDLIALFAGDPAQNLAVSGGDTIFVPRPAQFYVYGEVQRPGVYRLEHNLTVAQAISTGGGLTRMGSERRVLIKRRDANGVEHEVPARSADILRADDVLLVRQALF